MKEELEGKETETVTAAESDTVKQSGTWVYVDRLPWMFVPG